MARAIDEFTTGKPIKIAKALRSRLEAAIEAHLIAIDKLTDVLDAADGDENLEDGADQEPNLGHSGEGGDEREDDRADDEPSLAHTNDVNQERAHRAQSAWEICDGEQEHDGREDDREAWFVPAVG